MANPEHVARIRAEAIESAKPVGQSAQDMDFFYKINLAGSDLSRLDLSGVTILDSFFADVDFSHSKLTRASLYETAFYECNFTEADMTAVGLEDAEFAYSNLNAVDFRGTPLSRTLIRHSTLEGTEFENVTFDATVLVNVDLSLARGLDRISHDGPSVIDHRTLLRSSDLPLEFLRGVGLPDEVIDFYRAQYGKPIQYFSAFISYSRTDEEFVDRLHAELQNNGVRCWQDTKDMKIGDRMRPAINQAIRVHDKVVLVLSEHSIESDWVESEVEMALEKEREQGRTVLFPIRLDDSVMETDKAWAAEIRRTRNIGDFREWKDHDSYQVAFERVLRDLRPEAE